MIKSTGEAGFLGTRDKHGKIIRDSALIIHVLANLKIMTERQRQMYGCYNCIFNNSY